MLSSVRTANLTAIVRRFGLNRFRLQTYASYYKSNAAYRVSTRRRQWLLKPMNRRTPGLSPVKQMHSIASSVRKIQKASFAHMPLWRKAKSGRLWVIRHGRPYYVTEWIQGRPLRTESTDFEGLGRALAKLHSIGNETCRGKHGYTRMQLKRLARLDHRFRRQLPAVVRSRASEGKWFSAHAAECTALSDHARELLRHTGIARILADEALHPTYIHGDVTHPNIIVAASGVILIDWDNVRTDSAYFELAKTLANVTAFQPPLMHALLKGYEEIKPLQPDERALINAMFRFPREAWYSAHSRFHGRQNRVFAILRRSWPERMNAVQWLDAWAAHGLEQLKNGNEPAAAIVKAADESLER